MMAKGTNADLLIGNNVLAQVPDINDFVRGMEVLLKPKGVITMEFPHLMRLIEGNQFDTIYHEHFSYFSFIAVERVFCGAWDYLVRCGGIEISRGVDKNIRAAHRKR